MPFTVKHVKTNNIPDWTQSQLDTVIAGGAAPLPPTGTVLNDIVLPSDWNADLVVSGELPVANGGTGADNATDAKKNLNIYDIATYTLASGA